MPAVELRDIRFHYMQAQFLITLSLIIQKGEFFGVVGPNGSGKTTLLRIILGLLTPHHGSVLINDRPLAPSGRGPKSRRFASYPCARRELATVIGYLAQHNTSAFDFTTHEIVMMGRNPYLRPFQRPTQHDLARVRQALEFTDTWRLRTRRISQMSGGEQQRVFLARTLAQEPDILLLDEPFSQLDLTHQSQMLRLLRQLNHQGITVILVSHDLNLASIACTRLLILHQGAQIACGPPQKVLTHELIRQVYSVEPILQSHPQTRTPQIALTLD